MRKSTRVQEEEINKAHFFENLFKNGYKQETMINRYYQKYENTQRQISLLSFWQQTLNNFFAQQIKGSCIRYGELENFFTLDSVKPNGLKQILLKFQSQKEYLILNNLNSLNKINSLLGIQNENSVKKFFSGILSSFFKEKSYIRQESFVINTSIFRTQYHFCLNSQEKIFQSKEILEQDIYLQRCIDICQFSDIDNELIYQLMLMNKELFRICENGIIFCQPKKKSYSQIQLKVDKHVIFLKSQITKIEEHIEKLEQDIKKVQQLAIYYKSMQLKDTALLHIKNKRVFQDKAHKAHQYKMLLQETLEKLMNPRNNSELNNILKGCNQLLKNEGEFQNEIIEVIEDLQEVNYKHQEIGKILDENDQQDLKELEDMYDNLEEELSQNNEIPYKKKTNKSTNNFNILSNKKTPKNIQTQKNSNQNKSQYDNIKIDFDQSIALQNKSLNNYQSKFFSKKNKQQEYKDPFLMEMKQALDRKKKSQSKIDKEILELNH